MAVNFPDSPSNGDTHIVSGVTYTYNSTKNAWETIGGAITTTGSGDTPPANPVDGDLWFNSSSAELSVRYNDGTSSQWVVVSGAAGPPGTDGSSPNLSAVAEDILPDADSSRSLGSASKKWKDLFLSGDTISLGGIKLKDAGGSLKVETSAGADVSPGGTKIYANLAAFPDSGNTAGDMAFATDTKAVYMWDGTEWDRINSGGDETPRLTTTPSTTHDLNGDGSTSTITIAAEDPEGFPITYSHDTNPSSPNQVTSITNSGGVFTLTPSTTSAHAGNFALRLKASDGVHITSHAITVALAFQTNFTFDTSLSMINTNYTDTNKLEATVSTSSAQDATSEQIGIMGKGYLEYKVVTVGNYPMIGVGSGQAGVDLGYSNGNAVYLYVNGDKYSGAVGTSLFSGLLPVNSIVMVAYDTVAEEVWLGYNGAWPSGKDPTAGQSGYSCGGAPATHGFKPALTSGSSTAGTTQLEIISHTQGAQYTIPSGWVLA